MVPRKNGSSFAVPAENSIAAVAAHSPTPAFTNESPGVGSAFFAVCSAAKYGERHPRHDQNREDSKRYVPQFLHDTTIILHET